MSSGAVVENRGFPENVAADYDVGFRDERGLAFNVVAVEDAEFDDVRAGTADALDVVTSLSKKK